MDPYAPLEWDGLSRPARIIHRTLDKAGTPIVQRRLGWLAQLSDKMTTAGIVELLRAGIVRYDSTPGGGGRLIALTSWPERNAVRPSTPMPEQEAA